MKNPTINKKKSGFTLIELLVVIAIIAVLAAASFGGALALKEKAKRTTAQAAAMSLVTAVNAFYSEYTTLPNVAASTDTNSPVLLNILMAKEEAGPDMQNDRKIRFLEMKQAKGDKGGIIYDGDDVDSLADPWGQPYHVVLNTNYEDSITVLGTVLRNQNVAVYSYGTSTPATAKPNTLVKTW